MVFISQSSQTWYSRLQLMCHFAVFGYVLLKMLTSNTEQILFQKDLLLWIVIWAKYCPSMQIQTFRFIEAQYLTQIKFQTVRMRTRRCLNWNRMTASTTILFTS